MDGDGETCLGKAARLFDDVGSAAKLSLEGVMGEERPLCTAGSRIGGGANVIDSVKAGKSAGSVRAHLFGNVGEVSPGEVGSSILAWGFTTNRKSCMNRLWFASEGGRFCRGGDPESEAVDAELALPAPDLEDAREEDDDDAVA